MQDPKGQQLPEFTNMLGYGVQCLTLDNQNRALAQIS